VLTSLISSLRCLSSAQGESNTQNATDYACRFPSLINDWRTQFTNPLLSFYYVVIAAYREGASPAWMDIRQAQLTALALPYTGLATAHDLGDEEAPNAIHPRNKSILGQRLADVALYQLYGQKSIVPYGPQFSTITWPIPSSPIQTVILTFDSSLTNNYRLQLKDTSDCVKCCQQSSPIAVLMRDGRVVEAKVNVYADQFVVLASVEGGGDVVGVALNYVLFPECSVYNGANLPHLPFNITKP
jgi:hypothetical protein